MAMLSQEVKAWINEVEDDALIAIDEGGMCVIVVGDDRYIEVGGEPLDEEDEVSQALADLKLDELNRKKEE